MTNKTGKVEPVVDDSVEIRRGNGKTEKVAPAAADILLRKEEGCVLETEAVEAEKKEE